MTVMNEGGPTPTSNAKVDAALNQAKGSVNIAYGEARRAVLDAAVAAKEMALDFSHVTGGFITARPNISVIAMFTLGLFFGVMSNR